MLNYNNFLQKNQYVIEHNFNNIKKFKHSNYKIGMVNNNHILTYKSVLKYFKDNNIDYTPIFSNSTSSRYLEFTDKNDNFFKIRFANHTPALSDLDEHVGIFIEYDFNYDTFNTVIDNSFGYKSNDIKKIIHNLQNKYFNIIKNDKLNLILSDFEYMYKNDFDDIVNKILTTLNIVDDEYNSAKAVIQSIVDAYKEFHYYDGYSEYYKNMKNAQENKNKLKTEDYISTNGIIINTNNSKLSYFWKYDYSKLNITGKSNKKLRNDLINDAKNELLNKINNNEIN
jgi:hypothetical protein